MPTGQRGHRNKPRHAKSLLMAKKDEHKTGDGGRMTLKVRRITSCRRLVRAARTRLRGINQKGWRTRGQLNLPV
eukprot:444547-Pleurochrysis_carterae.AAC.1